MQQTGLEINKILKSHLSTKWQKIVAKCKFLVAKSNRTQSIDIMKYSMLKGLQCIIGRFRTGVAILKFSRGGRDQRESFTFVCLGIIKHGYPVGNQRIGFVLLYLFE